MNNHQTDPLTEETRRIAELAEQAEQGDAEAQYRIGIEISMNNVFIYDPVKVAERSRIAAEWFRKAAEQGHAGAMFSLGLHYFFNSGERPEDEPKALAWLSLAADMGATGHPYV